MAKFLKNFFLSIKSAVFFMFIFAIAIGVATFIENDYGTQSAKALVYNARWFEILLVILGINLVYNIFRFRLYRKEKWLTGLFHFAFILILIGAAVTRYFGYEGIMHIREGAIQDKIVSDRAYLQADIVKDGKKYHFEFPLLLSALGKNSFKKVLKFDNDEIEIDLKKYIPNAKTALVKDKNGDTYIELMIAFGNSPQSVTIKKGDFVDLGDFIIAFEKEPNVNKKVIKIEQKGDKLYIKSPFAISTFRMSENLAKNFKENEEIVFEKGKLYGLKNLKIVLKDFKEGVKTKLISAGPKPKERGLQDALVLEIKNKNIKKSVTVFGKKGQLGNPATITLGDTKLFLTYGSKIIKLPFALKLVDFQIEKYPGSNSPSSYASEVILIDKEKDIKMPFRIYMNHVLDYRGYRFFQSSYDMDERGTILSVNHDPGTIITYIGYAMLFFGLIFHLFMPQSRFMKLIRLTKKVQKKRESLVLSILFLFIFFPYSIKASQINYEEALKVVKSFDKKHCEKFGELLVQDRSGRVEPIDTLSREVLAKVTRKEKFLGLNPNQIFLGMTVKPNYWQVIKMIYLHHPQLKKIIGLKKDEKYAAFQDFFDKNGEYKLAKYVQEAVLKKPAQRNQFDKDVIKVDERVNVCYMVYVGDLLRIFPKPNDKNQKWYSPVEAIKSFPPKEAELVRLIIASYFSNIDKALENGDWKKADEALDVIKNYQKYYGASIIPKEKKIKAELLYNRLDIFNRLVPYYMIIGSILLILVLANLINPKIKIGPVIKIGLFFIILGFFAHTFGLALRWYVAGHAPWSDGYESMVYISWAIVLAGFFFSKNSPVALATTALLGGLILFVAHLNWLDPQITNLVPVLKSYWLMIHVSVITASYGFLALSALLAFIVLILYIFMNQKNKESLVLTIKELTYTNEMSLIIGLVLVTIGNFLGGVWANESWGRYWGWDPKETWALVTILIYACVEHLRLIPKLNGLFLYNVMSLLAFSSVIMTYFGVNFYLSGLHSYAQGDPVPIPTWVYYAISLVFSMIALAYYKRRKLNIDLRMN
ncbi:cytochrome c biogenesis protein CcsA [Nitrosophilus kaiyonis]|uniref:cytochrome c biogenesis protein CcsA n=1 Tax=Nitrosophilus kaiyonis TaxID=2930200 RepID=UPI002493159C|nr:cytochrome c biogenesis protein CcsA [Nitrosophilus kaiyonis]